MFAGVDILGIDRHKKPRVYAGLDVNPAGFGTLRNLGWLGDVDSNHDRQCQRLQSYH